MRTTEDLLRVVRAEFLAGEYANAEEAIAKHSEALRAQIAEITAERNDLALLVKRAVRIAASRRRTSAAWWAVERAFACGSARARDLCRAHGIDPDERPGGRRRAAQRCEIGVDLAEPGVRDRTVTGIVRDDGTLETREGGDR